MNRPRAAVRQSLRAPHPPARLAGCLLLASAPLLAGCGMLAKGSARASSAGEQQDAPAVAVEMPWDTTAVRDDAEAPVLKLALLGEERAPAAVPYLYGYPLYPKGDAARGLFKLRADNWEGAEAEQFEDEHGVIHRVERLPRLGCTIEGFQETPQVFVPVSLRCEVPPPEALGGAARPVLAELKAGAGPEQVVESALIQKAFFGDWHLIEGNLEREGEGLFNTPHGQLGFGFEDGKLARVTFYFDPPEQAWRSAALWMEP